MSAPPAPLSFDWEAAGRQLGATLDSFHALVVTGSDPTATGHVALGIGRTQAAHRRVAVADLFADSPPIATLAQNDDPHGIVDSFLYGVSLGRIARPVADAPQLVVMPSGSEPPVYEEMLPNPRWKRLMAGFHEVGALIVLAVPSSAAHIEDLALASDGVIVVGESMPQTLPASMVVATVRIPREGSRSRTRRVERVTERSSPVAAAGALPGSAAAPGMMTRIRGAAATVRRWRPRSVPGIVLSATIVAVVGWLAYRPLSKAGHSALGGTPDSAKSMRLAQPANAASTTSSVLTNAPSAAQVRNAGDSAQAALYAVQLTAANTATGAILKLQQDGKSLPAATYAQVLVQGSPWFKVIAGAYVDRADADSLLAGLRRRGVLDAVSGMVVRVPFAFLISDSVTVAAVPGMVTAYGDRGQPVYALRQSDGTAWLLVGAFETAEESSLYAESLRASGITPVLVYRKGRTF